MRCLMPYFSIAAGGGGFTLVELVIAAVVAAVVLAGSWGWLWNTGRAAKRSDHEAQAATAAASAVRAVAADLACATAVLPPPAERPQERCLHLRHDHPGSGDEEVLICWDPRRDVMWRNAPGTYLSDHVVAFGLEYVLVGGKSVPATGMAAGDWSAVRLVRMGITVDIDGSAAVRRLAIAVGAG